MALSRTHFNTMKLWLLLVSLLVSNLSLLGDGDCIMDYYSWSLCRKRLLNEQMALKGLETLLTQTVHYCMCIQRNVAVQHKQQNVPSYQGNTIHKDHGCLLSLQALTVIIYSSYFPIIVWYTLFIF